jgi:hypothetical protein
VLAAVDRLVAAEEDGDQAAFDAANVEGEKAATAIITV